MFSYPATDDFFRSRIDHIIDLRHPLAVLTSRMPWQQIEASISHLSSRKGHAGVAMPNLDLFCEAPALVARVSHAGRPRIPLRTMIALLYLKHAFNESDKGYRLHAVLCAAGYNLKWLLRLIAKKGIRFLSQLFLHLTAASVTLPVGVRQLIKVLSSSGFVPAHRLWMAWNE